MKINPKFLFGILVVVVGVVLLFEQAGVFPLFSKYIWAFFAKLWPLILIAFGAKLLIARNIFPGFLLLLLGITFLATNLFSWDFFSVLWPVVIIALGISLLFKTEEKKEEGKVLSDKDFLSETVLFWGVDKKVKSKNFKGGELNVAFGGLALDLRDVEVSKEGAKLHINCAFGGVEIFVPKECRIKTSGTGILGGWNPEVKDRKIESPVLEITGGVIFGGVDIKD